MPRRFGLYLAGLVLLGLGVRLGYAFALPVSHGAGDDVWYHTMANGLVDGRGFTDPFVSLGRGEKVLLGTAGERIPTAFHLPLFPGLLAVGSELGADGYRAHQVIGCLLGSGTVAVVGLVGRRLGGDRAGLLSAAVAAVYLPLAVNDAVLRSESLYGLLIAVTFLLVLRLRESPTWRRAAALGAVLGLAALTRSEALLFALLLAPLVWSAGGRRTRNLLVAGAAIAVVVLPWAVRNTVVFDRPVGLTTGAGSVAAGANIDTTYHGRLLGAWDPLGLYRTPAGRTLRRNEAVQSGRWRRDAQRYVGDHLGRLPVVVAARVGRTWSLYPLAPAEKVRFASDYYSHLHSAEYAVLLAYVAGLGLAIAGAVALRRSGGPLWLFVAPAVLVTLISAFGYGDTRFRQAADVSIAVLAGLGVDALLNRRSRAT
ncbi:MAG TPA: glycosyltransferase family 39 protein [Thermoleophilaceae bacterium]|nr:glycosyltransferase family 39 protein [Thermoleophilaceae bacterium]